MSGVPYAFLRSWMASLPRLLDPREVELAVRSRLRHAEHTRGQLLEAQRFVNEVYTPRMSRLCQNA